MVENPFQWYRQTNLGPKFDESRTNMSADTVLIDTHIHT